MQIESGGNEYAKNAKSGAAGLMQILPSISKNCGIDPFDPISNIRCGVDLLTTIRKTLHQVDPARFQVEGFPGEFERKAIAAGYVRGWSLKAGIAKDMKTYRGEDWLEFLGQYPDWSITSPYVDRVSILTTGWEDKLKGIYVAEQEQPERPIHEAGMVGKGINGKALIGLLLTFFLSLVYIVVRSCSSWEVHFK